MPAGIRITVRNEHDEIVEYHSGQSVLHLDLPEGRYVITVSCEAMGAPDDADASLGTLH
jgi:hypothetical protein